MLAGSQSRSNICKPLLCSPAFLETRLVFSHSLADGRYAQATWVEVKRSMCARVGYPTRLAKTILAALLSLVGFWRRAYKGFVRGGVDKVINCVMWRRLQCVSSAKDAGATHMYPHVRCSLDGVATNPDGLTNLGCYFVTLADLAKNQTLRGNIGQKSGV